MPVAKVKFRGSVRDVVKSTKDTLDLHEGATVQDLITALVDKHGDSLARRILTPDSKLQIHTHIFVDGDEIDYERMEATMLAKGEPEVEVEIFVVQMTMGGSPEATGSRST